MIWLSNVLSNLGLLFIDGENIGQIDIDSHTPDPFSKEDERFLEFVNEKVAEILEK